MVPIVSVVFVIPNSACSLYGPQWYTVFVVSFLLSNKNHLSLKITVYMLLNANPSGETATKRVVTLDASTSSSLKKYSKVLVEPQNLNTVCY